MRSSNSQKQQKIRKDFYADDLLTGANSIKEASDIVRKVSLVLASAAFKLRKWISNKQTVIKNIPSEDQNPNYVNFIDDGQIKTLGLVQKAHRDTLIYTIKETSQTKVTKRVILLEITQVFDPLGLLSPYVIVAKILLQL